MGDGEEFDSNSVVIANVNNQQDGADKIVIGSFEGKLRVYEPNRKGDHKFNVDDLIVEKDFGFPILQVRCGKFSKSRPGLCLAVLSNRQISVHAVESTSAYSELVDLFVHKLERNAFNFIHG